MSRVNIIVLWLIFINVPAVTAANLTLGVYTSDKASSMYKKFSPIIKYLNQDLTQRTGSKSKVKLKIYKSYAEAQDALVKGEIDFARFGPASYIQVKYKNPGIELLLMENKKGKKHFNGVIAVPVDSSIKSLNDLQGSRFAFGNERSTIGRYLAQAEMIKAGIYAKDLKEYKFFGRHDKVFKAITVGGFDAGSLKEPTFKKLNKKNQLRVIHRFEVITKPWLLRSGFEPSLKQALKNSLLALHDKNILKAHKIKGFFETNDAMYNFVREGMSTAENF